MYAQELLVHDGSQWQGTEGFHASIIHFLRVFVLAFQLEGEIIGQVTAFVIASQKPKSVGIPDLE